MFCFDEKKRVCEKNSDQIKLCALKVKVLNKNDDEEHCFLKLFGFKFNKGAYVIYEWYLAVNNNNAFFLETH